MSAKKILIIFLAIILLLGVGLYVLTRSGLNIPLLNNDDADFAPSLITEDISSFEDCASAGYALVGASSRTCTGPDGTVYRENPYAVPDGNFAENESTDQESTESVFPI